MKRHLAYLALLAAAAQLLPGPVGADINFGLPSAVKNKARQLHQKIQNQSAPVIAQSAPAAPSALFAVTVSSRQINLAWQDNSNNEDGFKMERKTGAGGNYSQIAAPAAGAISYSNTGLSAGTTYYYRMRAYNSAGDSAYSDEAGTVTMSADAANRPPVISALTPNRSSISTGAVTTITCTASDPDGDTLTYAWTAASGTISGGDSQAASWTAPASSGTYRIYCTVSDGKGGSAQQSVNIDVTISGALAVYKLPDTGQELSYSATFGEDHDYQPAASQPSYNDNNSGNVGNGTITDNRTGLMWVKVGTSAGCNNGNTLTWEQALTFCETLAYSGYSDWRLPNRRELMSIADYGESGPAVNAEYFPNTRADDLYWTSTTHVPATALAWLVNFGGGVVTTDVKTVNRYVRCVRAGP